MQATYDAVVALTDAFCRDHLNDEYRDLARAMTAALCRKRPSPLASGQPRTWACGIIHVLGRLNFLSDKASQPYMTMAEVSAAFGVGESTASAKARAISDALHTNRMDPTWMLKSIVDRNPFVWMARGQWHAGRHTRNATRGAGHRLREAHDPLAFRQDQGIARCGPTSHLMSAAIRSAFAPINQPFEAGFEVVRQAYR